MITTPCLASRIHLDRAPDDHWRPRPRADLDLLRGAQLDRENRDAQFTRVADAYSRKVESRRRGSRFTSGSTTSPAHMSISRPRDAGKRITCQRPSEFPHRRPCIFPADGHEKSPGTAIGIPQGRPRELPADGHVLGRVQSSSGFTPLPEVASAKRTDSPSVTMTWA